MSLYPSTVPILLVLLQLLPDSLHVLAVLADGDQGKVELVHRFRNRLQAGDRPLILPVEEDVAGKDGGRHKTKDHQNRPSQPGGMRFLQQVLNSFRQTNLCWENYASPTMNRRIFCIAFEKSQYRLRIQFSFFARHLDQSKGLKRYLSVMHT